MQLLCISVSMLCACMGSNATGIKTAVHVFLLTKCIDQAINRDLKKDKAFSPVYGIISIV